ncbi:hypothetical protein X975_03139, partial [Stegodyphus mimosarum]
AVKKSCFLFWNSNAKYSHVITFILIPCAVDAVPLGVIINCGQKENYEIGLRLLIQTLKRPFYGSYPRVVTTDDSDAERNTDTKVWPNAQKLLCQFHVCQAVWK